MDIPPVGYFKDGFYIESHNQALYLESSDKYVAWRGNLPHELKSGLTPETDGGYGPTAWADVSNLEPSIRSDNMVLVEDFFHLVTDDGDWTPAAQAALKHAFDNKLNKVWSFQRMAFKSPLRIDNWGRGLEVRFANVEAHKNFPVYTDWKNATPLILIGGSSGGGMVALEIHIGYMNGKTVANGISVQGPGCGGSRIHIGRAIDCNIVYDCSRQTHPSASNFITGDYWHRGNMGAYFARGTSGKQPVAEGHKLSVGFITGMIYGGSLWRNGSQYGQISGDADFNGRYLSEVTLSGNSFTGLERGAEISNGTASGEVLAFYAQTAGVYKVLIIEKVNVSGGNSSFATGDKLTSGSWSGEVSAVRTAEQGQQFYFDIILDFYGSAFAKIDVDCGYLGGIVGHSLHSCSLNYKSSYSAYTNSMNGAQWVHSGSTMTLRDSYLNKNVLDSTADFVAPGGHLFMRNYRTYGSEFAVSFAPAQERTIRTFSYIGSTNAPGVKDIYEVQVFGPTGLSGICSSFKVAVSPSGLEIYDSTIKDTSKLQITADKLSLKARQDSPHTFTLYFTFNRK
ncbi:Uncharacterised protein [Serratia rubidaea]|nr:Uncharacterised protein [Serratia rubidaea]